MGSREEFFKIKNPQALLDYIKKNKDLHFDADMARHFNDMAKQYFDDETPENHTDPREAFIEKSK